MLKAIFDNDTRKWRPATAEDETNFVPRAPTPEAIALAEAECRADRLHRVRKYLGRRRRREANRAYCEFVRREHARLDRMPDQVAADDAADRAKMDAEHAAWLASGAPDLLAELQTKRAAERTTALAERDAIENARRAIYMAADSTDEQVERADAAYETALAEWHRKYDYLWPKPLLERARKRWEGEQDKYVAAMRAADRAITTEAAMSLVPFPKSQPDLIQNSASFVRGFAPPDYLVDGILQRRFCYSMTAQTGVGKTTVAMLLSAHVSAGLPLGSIAVEKGTVLYFAGENPTDIQMRWLGLTHRLNMDPGATDVHFVAGALALSQVAERITAEVSRKGLQPALVVVDTAAAYFEGDDENSNAQAAAHAKLLRSLTTLPGGPCVLILCHPTKRAADDDLIPRGGGAFLAEVDGNIALQRRDALLVASAQGKFRGSDAWSLRFELETVRDHPELRDVRGRQIPTVIARPIEDAAVTIHEARGEGNENAILRALPAHGEGGGATPTDVARKLGWFVKNDPNQPAHNKVSRILQSLRTDKLVEQARQNRWRLTSKGELELNRLERTAAQRGLPVTPILPPTP